MENKDIRVKRLTGSTLWRLRPSKPSQRIYGDPEELWAEACAYFQWCDTHPLLRAELVKYKGESSEVEVSAGRPYTMDGLTVYLCVSNSYFRTLKADLRDKDEKGDMTEIEGELYETVEAIERVIRTQQIEGAACGLFNSNLISRINGLADNINQNNTGDAVIRVTVRDAETSENLKELEKML